jgi:hypothetical protein
MGHSSIFILLPSDIGVWTAGGRTTSRALNDPLDVNDDWLTEAILSDRHSYFVDGGLGDLPRIAWIITFHSSSFRYSAFERSQRPLLI